MEPIKVRRPASAGRGASRQIAVERAEAYLHSNVGAAVPVADLCRIVGVSERGLRNAFRELRGLSPKRYVICERLHEVRRELGAAVGPQTTVTSIATRHGFFELGRFAGAYKEMFGEPPSVTLRRAIASGNHGDTVSENANVCHR